MKKLLLIIFTILLTSTISSAQAIIKRNGEICRVLCYAYENYTVYIKPKTASFVRERDISLETCQFDTAWIGTENYCTKGNIKPNLLPQRKIKDGNELKYVTDVTAIIGLKEYLYKKLKDAGELNIKRGTKTEKVNKTKFILSEKKRELADREKIDYILDDIMENPHNIQIEGAFKMPVIGGGN